MIWKQYQGLHKGESGNFEGGSMPGFKCARKPQGVLKKVSEVGKAEKGRFQGKG